MAGSVRADRGFPILAGVLLGLGLGGFFDGIILHQVLQWHHMLSSWYPLSSLENYKINTLWDGIFHSATYLFVIAGLFVLWRHSQRHPILWSASVVIGSGLLGFGVFNIVEGLIDHHLLGIHHVNELVAEDSQWLWDLAFLVWGAVMVVFGSWLIQTVKRKGHRAAVEG
jgi:uncharacterized membrane protein